MHGKLKKVSFYVLEISQLEQIHLYYFDASCKYGYCCWTSHTATLSTNLLMSRGSKTTTSGVDKVEGEAKGTERSTIISVHLLVEVASSTILRFNAEVDSSWMHVLKCRQQYQVAPLIVHELEVTVDLFVLSLQGFDGVLGVSGLKGTNY
ncbi:unnamed protein product [Linum trigynum]|uniref:Uncharacterized protein n=1 Tax=Linum trigynum TaxID=586398 RepID=A0AAV2DWJ4_9ROSI